MLRNSGDAHVSKNDDEIGSFKKFILGASLDETVRESKAIVGELDNDIPLDGNLLVNPFWHRGRHLVQQLFFIFPQMLFFQRDLKKPFL